MVANLLSAATLLLLPLAAHASPVQARDASPVTVTVDTNPPARTHNAPYDWAAGWNADFPIHPSCNATLRAQLQAGLDDAVTIAAHARDHLLRWGTESEIAQKYFGNISVAGPIGWYSRIVSAHKEGMLFRCDDPDQNCATQEGWAGHWRGANATQETVICDLSYSVRLPLSAACNLGYTVASSPLNTYWATDLLHRLLHVPLISDGLLEHYADDHAGVLQLAVSDPEKAVLDSDGLQYFAIEAWGYDIAAPGVGCPGESETPTAAPEEEPSSTESSAPTGTADADDSCHTHSDGVVHCD